MADAPSPQLQREQERGRAGAAFYLRAAAPSLPPGSSPHHTSAPHSQVRARKGITVAPGVGVCSARSIWSVLWKLGTLGGT